MGRYFKFPIDVHLSAAPSLNCEGHTALYNYLHDVSIDSNFATLVLQILVEERCTDHCTRWNDQLAAKSFKIGDVVKAHIQMYYQASKDYFHFHPPDDLAPIQQQAVAEVVNLMQYHCQEK